MATSSVTFSGIASGIDSASLIDSLVSVAKNPINRLNEKKTTYSAQSKKLTDIRTKMLSLQTAARALDTTSEAMLNKATSSKDTVLKATAVGGSSLGTFDITVEQLAQAERTYSNRFDSRSDEGVAGSGTLTVQVGTDDAYEIEVGATDSLEDIASKINSSGASVTAGVVYDGTKYRLQVGGNESGAENGITFTEGTGLSLGLSDPANEARAAQNAKMTFDAITFESATNSVTNVIPGVTLDLVDKGASTVVIDRDPDSLKTKLDTFVTAYNDIMKTLNTEFSYSGVTKGNESLIGDSMLHQVQAQLRSMVSQSDASSFGSINSLGSIGIALQRDGTLALDAEKLKKASSSDYQGVARMLGSQDGSEGMMRRINSVLDPIVRTDGSLRTRITSLADKSRGIDKQVESQQTRIDKYEESLRRQFTALESLMGNLQNQNLALTSMINSL